MPFQDLYDLLRVPPGAPFETIRAAYRKLCKRYHPDTGLPGASKEQMALINHAYAVLSDARLRAAYDAGYPSARTRRERQAWATGDRRLNLGPGVAIPLVNVPAGEVLMGDCAHGRVPGAGCSGLSRPYAVHLPAYSIGVYPVTVAAYALFVEQTGRLSTPWARRSLSFDLDEWDEPELVTRLDRKWNQPGGAHSSVQGKEDHPVMVVTWCDATAFCRWASETSGASVRLPTAAEWQRAAYGSDARCYPWGHESEANPALCNCRPASEASRRPGEGDTTPVGAYSPHGDSPHGCADVLGNVWEWTSTRSRNRENTMIFGHPYRANDGREEPNVRDPRLLLGGSYSTPAAALCRGSARELEPLRAQDTGFRVVVDG